MDRQHLEAMLKRRGYGMATTPIIEPSTGCIGTGYLATARGMRLAPVWSEIEHPHPDFKQAETTEEMTAYIDRVLGGGQHHMQCGQCGEPILCKQGYDETPNGIKVPDNVYLSVKDGPDGEWLDNCPSCGISLYNHPPQEIDDLQG